MLGFQVFHLGGIEQTQDAVDLIAASPNGDLLLVECTTGVLKTDKVSNLLSRATVVRAALANGGFSGRRVVPIIATTKSEDEVFADIGAVEKDGALVVCREQIEEWLTLSAARPDANGLVWRAHQRLRNLQAEADGSAGTEV
jgi:hypothetical protein